MVKRHLTQNFDPMSNFDIGLDEFFSKPPLNKDLKTENSPEHGNIKERI
jgi:hypothetical protein